MPEQTPTASPTSPEPSSSEPAVTTTEQPSTGSPADAFAGFDFSNMDFADESGDTTVVDHTKTEPGKPESVVQQAPPAAPSPQGAPEPTVVQTAPTAQPATPTPAPAQQPPPSAVPAGEDPYIETWKQNAQQLDGELQKYYALDDATAEALLENPKQALPAILAKAHMAILQNTYKAVLDRLPPLMQNTAQALQQNAQNEDRFFKAWPVFNRNDPNQMSVLTQYAQLFRSQNPGASEADFTKFVGAASAAHLGLKVPAKKANGQDRKPMPYNPAAGTAPASGSGEPKPTQFEDLFNVIIGGQE